MPSVPTIALGAVIGQLLLGCARKEGSAAAKLPPFFITNTIAGGELRQVIQITNGVSLYLTASNICVWFTTNSDIVIAYDPVTLRPMKTLLTVPPFFGEPAQKVYDSNADGVPEMRRLDGERQSQIFYHGEWYPYRLEGNQQNHQQS